MTWFPPVLSACEHKQVLAQQGLLFNPGNSGIGRSNPWREAAFLQIGPSNPKVVWQRGDVAAPMGSRRLTCLSPSRCPRRCGAIHYSWPPVFHSAARVHMQEISRSRRGHNCTKVDRKGAGVFNKEDARWTISGSESSASKLHPIGEKVTQHKLGVDSESVCEGRGRYLASLNECVSLVVVCQRVLGGLLTAES